MNLVRHFELHLAKWLKQTPNLPKNVRDWLATNSWWIILVVAILSGVTAVGALVGFVSKLSVAGVAAAGAWWVFNALISLVLTVAVTILFGMAVSPLRSLEKKGWVLVFMAILVEAIGVVLSALSSLVTTAGVGGFLSALIWGVVYLLLSAYFLYEIRGYFSLPARTLRVAPKK